MPYKYKQDFLAYRKRTRERHKELSRESYYRHRESRLRRMKIYALKNRDKILAYHKKYWKNYYPEVKEKVKAYQADGYLKNWKKQHEYSRKYKQTEIGKKNHCEIARKDRIKHPLQHQARSAVAQAVRSGRLIKKPCEICGSMEKIEAHHNDYRKKLIVRWLCAYHHRVVEGRAKILTG